MRKNVQVRIFVQIFIVLSIKNDSIMLVGISHFLVPFIVHFFITVFLTLCPIDHLGLVVIGGYTHKVTTVLTLHLKQPKASPTFPDIPWDAY